MGRRGVRIGVLGFVGWIFLAAFVFGPWFLKLPLRLLLGWVDYLERTLPAVSINGMGICGSIMILLLVGAGAQLSARSFLPSWQLRWTAAGVSVFLLLFVANIAVIGSIHQIVWLMREPSLRHSWESPDFLMHRFCGDVFRDTGTAGQLRAELWRLDSSYRPYPRVLQVIARDTDEGLYGVILPRDPAMLEKHGILICAPEGRERHSAQELPEILHELPATNRDETAR